MRQSFFAFSTGNVYVKFRSLLRAVRDYTRTQVRLVLTAAYAPNNVISSNLPPDVEISSIMVADYIYAVGRIWNGQVYTNRKNNLSIFYKKFIIPSFCRQRLKTGAAALAVELPPDENPLLTRRLLISSRRRRIDSFVVSLLAGGGAKNNYYHWLFDCLPRLEILKKSGFVCGDEIFLIPNDEFEFQNSTLDVVGIPANRRLNANEFRFIKANAIIACEHPNLNPNRTPRWIVDYLRAEFLPQCNANVNHSTGRAIFLSREDASSRRMLNEADLFWKLQAIGFEKVLAGELSFSSQVSLFSEAKVIVGTHGAGFTNLVFAPPNTVAIEIFPSAGRLPYFSRVAELRGLPYMSCHGVPQQNIKNLNTSNFILDEITQKNVVERAKAALKGSG